MRDLIAELREESHPLAHEAADAIETLTAELRRAEHIIQEQARAYQILRKANRNEGK